MQLPTMSSLHTSQAPPGPISGPQAPMQPSVPSFSAPPSAPHNGDQAYFEMQLPPTKHIESFDKPSDPNNSQHSVVTTRQNGFMTSSGVQLPMPPQPPRQAAQMGIQDINEDPSSPNRLKNAMESIVDLKVFLVTAPAMFAPNDIIRRFHLPSDEEVSCVRWNDVFYITGTDIVRCLAYRFASFGRVITNKKKFEEGVFSDLRNLKCNIDATLEKPKSEFLEFLYKHHCVRTKKKQKVFFWYSVRHERLFIDALERDLKKEATATQGGDQPTTAAYSEPALSFRYDPQQALRDQISTIIGEMPTPLAAIIDATISSHVVPVGPTDTRGSGDPAHYVHQGGQITQPTQLRFRQTGGPPVHHAQAQVQAQIQNQIQAQLHVQAQAQAQAQGAMGQYPRRTPKLPQSQVPSQGVSSLPRQPYPAHSPMQSHIPKGSLRIHAPSASASMGYNSMSTGFTPTLPSSDYERYHQYAEAPDSAKYYENAPGWSSSVTPNLYGVEAAYSPVYDYRSQVPGGGGLPASQYRPPLTSAVSTGPGRGKVPAALDMELVERGSDFPLDMLRKEDIRVGNTPTSAFFAMHEDVYDSYGGPPQAGRSFGELASPNVQTFGMSSSMPYLGQGGPSSHNPQMPPNSYL